MLKTGSGHLRPAVSRSTLSGSTFGPIMQVRNAYVPPGGKSLLPQKRALRKLKIGELRPAIYYKFDCKVQLSDGSTVTRRSQFPKTEIRYLADQRSHPLWNPSRPNIKAQEADATGRLAKFKKRYGDFDSSGGPEASETTAEAAADSAEPEKKDAAADSFFDLLQENAQPVQSGGQLMATLRKKNKKRK